MVNTYVVIRLNGKWVLHVIEVEKNKYVTVVSNETEFGFTVLSFILTHSLTRSIGVGAVFILHFYLLTSAED